MKITGSIRTAYVQKPTTTPGKADKPTGGRASTTEKVHVSDVARELASARGPETPDAERVERLKTSIADRSFEVDANAIAEQMLLEDIE